MGGIALVAKSQEHYQSDDGTNCNEVLFIKWVGKGIYPKEF